MFELKNPTNVKLDKLNSRIEMHGEAHVLAVDLKCTLQTSSTILDQFHPDLRAALYCSLSAEAAAKRATEAGQTEMQLPITDLPNMRFVTLGYPLKWDIEATGYTCRIESGIGGKFDIVLKLCTLKNFRFTPIEGGSCEVELTISSAADIDERIAGKLSVMQQSDITLTLLAPTVVDGGLIDASAGSGAPGTGPAAEPEKKPKAKSKAVRDATDAFVDAHAPTH